MAYHVRARKGARGTTYRCRVRIKQGGKVVHEENQSFGTLRAATAWGKQRDAELDRPGILAKVTAPRVTVAEVCKWYRENFEKRNRWQRSKGAAIRALENSDLGPLDACKLTRRQVLDYVQHRRDYGAGEGRKPAGPATVGFDLTWLKVVFKAARALLELPLPLDMLSDAQGAAKELKLIGRSVERDRRPTADELLQLDEFFARKALRKSGRPMADSRIPMREVMWFAIVSSRRASEICRLEWDDNDQQSLTGVVRDLKDPREKIGNHRRFKYTAEGWAIVQRQPRRHADDGALLPFFPYDGDSVSAAWARACKLLGIDDLHFHDLRHEATSRLFESGYEIPMVAQFTLHENWASLQRYTKIRPERVQLRAANETVPLLPPDDVLGIIEMAKGQPVRVLPAITSRPGAAG